MNSHENCWSDAESKGVAKPKFRVPFTHFFPLCNLEIQWQKDDFQANYYLDCWNTDIQNLTFWTKQSLIQTSNTATMWLQCWAFLPPVRDTSPLFSQQQTRMFCILIITQMGDSLFVLGIRCLHFFMPCKKFKTLTIQIHRYPWKETFAEVRLGSEPSKPLLKPWMHPGLAIGEPGSTLHLWSCISIMLLLLCVPRQLWESRSGLKVKDSLLHLTFA